MKNRGHRSCPKPSATTHTPKHMNTTDHFIEVALHQSPLPQCIITLSRTRSRSWIPHYFALRDAPATTWGCNPQALHRFWQPI